MLYRQTSGSLSPTSSLKSCLIVPGFIFSQWPAEKHSHQLFKLRTTAAAAGSRLVLTTFIYLAKRPCLQVRVEQFGESTDSSLTWILACRYNEDDGRIHLCTYFCIQVTMHATQIFTTHECDNKPDYRIHHMFLCFDRYSSHAHWPCCHPLHSPRLAR